MAVLWLINGGDPITTYPSPGMILPRSPGRVGPVDFQRVGPDMGPFPR